LAFRGIEDKSISAGWECFPSTLRLCSSGENQSLPYSAKIHPRCGIMLEQW
jgi:hypothetical protein